ncbi:MAG TPA: UPF0280 family protein [Bacillota bacterium]|jgi:hypothetical protein
MYEPRTYRDLFKGQNLVFFNCCLKETDLQIGAHRRLEAEAMALVVELRRQLEGYILAVPEFRTSLVPIDPAPWAPPIVRRMSEAGAAAGVGPMAAVAGAVSQFVGVELLRYSPEVIVENGGDIFIQSGLPRKIGIHAGSSPLSEKVALKIKPEDTPLGVCTSAGTVGPSLSFGRTDATVVVARDAALADAAATAIGNRVKTADDIEAGLRVAGRIRGLLGAVVIIGDKLGAWGDVDLQPF